MFKAFKLLFLGVSAWFLFQGPALAALPSDELLKEANQLFREYKDGEALQKYKQVLTLEPHNYEALYKLSLLDLRIGARFADETQKLQFYTSAKEYAQKALAVNNHGADAHYALAAALNNLAVVSGVKERLVNLKLVKDHLDQALAINPVHAEAWHLLGRWHYKAANLNFFECTASKFLAGGLPVGASNNFAIFSLNRSILYNPGNISSYYDLAVIYRDTKDPVRCFEILQKAVLLELVTSEDLELSRRCKALLQQLGKSSA